VVPSSCSRHLPLLLMRAYLMASISLICCLICSISMV
jgi:hypothetical protein